MTRGVGRPVTPDALCAKGEGIFYTDQPLVVVDQAIIDFLKQAALSVPRRRARLCAHPDAEADQHDMLIVSHRNTYVAPHRHLKKSETFLVLEGLANVVLFDEQGGVTETIAMGPVGSGRPFFYRMPKGQFHSLMIDSELLVFVESTKGPFVPQETENASWAPEPDRASDGRAYMAALASASQSR